MTSRRSFTVRSGPAVVVLLVARNLRGALNELTGSWALAFAVTLLALALQTLTG